MMKSFSVILILALVSSSQAFTEWQLLGHNNFRFLFKGSSSTWKTSNTNAQGFHYTRWDVPFGASANQNGGAAQRADDGHVFVQILGLTPENMQEWVGAEKRFGPPFVWEIDGNTGETVRMYNLSSVGDVFESPLRFTPSGNPMVAVQSKKKGFRLVVLDRTSDQILTVMQPPIEPLLIYPTNTNPPSAIMSSMNNIATIEFDSTGKTFAPKTAKTTAAISTVIFGVDGVTMYNGAVNLESAGLYRYKLPIHSGGAQKVTGAISPYPWQTCNDAAGNVYGLEGGSAKSFDNTGKSRWAKSAPAFWIALSDDEKMVISGDSVPPRHAVEKLHGAGIHVMNMVGAPKHVRKALAVGVDIICAQGTEGGGHTGEIASSILIPAVVDLCKGHTSELTGEPVYVVGAGGICDGRGLAMSLALGAQAVWIGTRFVAAKEAATTVDHRNDVLNSGFHDTYRTLVYSGRPLRIIKNKYATTWHDERAQEMHDKLSSGIVPMQGDTERANELKIRLKKGGQLTSDEKQFLEFFDTYAGYPHLCGQVGGRIQEVLPASEIVYSMVREAVAVLRNNGSRVTRVSKL